MIYFLLNIIFVNLFLYYKNYLFLVFLFISIIMFAKRSNLKLVIISIVGILAFYTCNLNYYHYDLNNTFSGECLVIEKKDKYGIVESNNKKYLIYNDDFEFYKNSKLYIDGYLERIDNTYNDFYKYLNKQGIIYKINYDKLDIINNSNSLNEKIVNKLLSKKKESTKSILKLILFNVKEENNKEFYNTFSIYSLTYLIAVSGFHIRILLAFFKKLFKKEFIGYSFVVFYLYLLDFSVSSYRAFLYYILKKINKKLDFDLSNNDLLSLIGSVFIFINPSIMFSYSFIFSFLTTFVLEIFLLYSKNKILISFYIYLVNIPLILLSNYKLNISTLLFSSILSLPVSFLYLFSFIYLFLDKFYLLYEIVIKLFFKAFSLLNKFNLVLIFGKPSSILIILYYLFLLCYFIFKERKAKQKFIYLFLCFNLLIYQYFKPIINYNEQLYFINVNQGDCTAFFIPHSKSVVLVDTGGNKYKDIATSEVIPFLESKGINKISKVIITHDDYDHNGALNSLIKNFKVDEVIDNSLITEINIGNKIFRNLNVSDRRDNDGSIVLLGEYAGYKVLLMGDASKKIEKSIVNEIKNVDIVKVGHHGSNTSSDLEFLKNINGKVAIISVGVNNSYGHPSEETLNNLRNANYYIFRTDENNDIGFGKNIFNIRFIDYFK